ncbi:hypothetical protein [Actinoplanes xinjiangensis]|uniref:hypothetical protein n=1 Tax=Actinoplanes xinjiangensis TaxID=512350 RepID=UPI0034245871
MPTLRSRVLAAVLALYPRRIRDRYGAEITDLLLHSPTPGRDLADVAWCALADRGASPTMSHARPHLVRLTGLLVTPLVFGVALAALTGIAVTVLAAVEGFGYRVGHRLVDVVIAVSVAPVAAGTVWLARRTGRREHVATPIPVVSTALALGTIAVASLPYLGAYPVVITGVDPGLVGDPAGQLAEALKGLPALLTVCTAFTVTLALTRATRRHATPEPVSSPSATS